jgi:hypothetical protein
MKKSELKKIEEAYKLLIKSHHTLTDRLLDLYQVKYLGDADYVSRTEVQKIEIDVLELIQRDSENSLEILKSIYYS